MKVDKFRTVIIYIIIILLGLVCLLPLLNIVAISFSSSAAVEGNMVGLIPVGFSTAAYEKILEDSQFWHSFLISVERVVLTLIINFVLIVLMAYPLSKTNAQFRGRNIYANLMIFAMLPGLLFALFERHGQPLEVVIQQMIQCCFIRPKERPYQTNNAYAALVRQYQMEQEVKAIVQKNDTPRNRKAQKAHPRPEKRN